MPQRPADAGSTAWYALLLSIVPFLAALSMLLLRLGIGPKSLLYYAAQTGGLLMFGALVVASAFGVIAWSRSVRTDWRVVLAFALQALSLLFLLLFFKGT